MFLTNQKFLDLLNPLIMPLVAYRRSLWGKWVNERIEKVKEFLIREEHSFVYPGKKDTVTRSGEKYQKVQLLEFLEILWRRYWDEFEDYRVHYAFFKNVFHSLPWLLSVKHNDTKVCLCMKHQNFALKVNVLRGLEVPRLPDRFLKEVTKVSAKDLMQESLADRVPFEVWRRGDHIYGDNYTCKKLRCEDEVLDKAEFIEAFIKEMDDMTEHNNRWWSQVGSKRDLLAALKFWEVLLHMDFAENYNVHYYSEPQSAFFSRENISVHCGVLYYLGSDGQIHRLNLVMVSDDRSHDPGHVYAVLDALCKIIREKLPRVTTVHYCTDSPTNQYRNRKIFSVLCKHEELFGLRGDWLYFEAGHGKGACDGLGAAAKRMADLAVKREHKIDNAEQFAAFGNQNAAHTEEVIEGNIVDHPTTKTPVSYYNITPEQIKDYRNKLKEFKTERTVLGTMLAHAAVVVEKDVSIAIRETSCYKPCCRTELGEWILGCDGWTIHHLYGDLPFGPPNYVAPKPRAPGRGRGRGGRGRGGRGRGHRGRGRRGRGRGNAAPADISDDSDPADDNSSDDDVPNDDHESDAANDSDDHLYHHDDDNDDNDNGNEDQPVDDVPLPTMGTYFASLYFDKWYVGQVLEDPQVGSEHVYTKYMEPGFKGQCTKNEFRWPESPDRLAVYQDDILCTILEPIRLPDRGSKNRPVVTWSLAEHDIDRIEQAYANGAGN